MRPRFSAVIWVRCEPAAGARLLLDPNDVDARVMDMNKLNPLDPDDIHLADGGRRRTVTKTSVRGRTSS
jgi:hypothetical protein